MFIAALFTRAKIWKQSKCQQAEKWMKKLWYIYTMEIDYRKENFTLWDSMDGPGEHYAK